jgi:hypothetical protein
MPIARPKADADGNVKGESALGLVVAASVFEQARRRRNRALVAR